MAKLSGLFAKLIENYGDDAARLAANYGDDAARVVANNADDNLFNALQKAEFSKEGHNSYNLANVGGNGDNLIDFLGGLTDPNDNISHALQVPISPMPQKNFVIHPGYIDNYSIRPHKGNKSLYQWYRDKLKDAESAYLSEHGLPF